MPDRKASEEAGITFDQVQFLIVDDHALVRHIVGECMKAYKVRRYAYAEDGAEAVQALRSVSRPEGESVERGAANPLASRPADGEDTKFRASEAYCVITDFQMPNLNGLQVLKAIRCGETEVPRNTPVIMLTSISEEYVVKTALQLDVSGFVLKPVVQKKLWERVQRAVKAQTVAKEIPAYQAVEIPDAPASLRVGQGKLTANTVDKPFVEKDIDWVPLEAVRVGAVIAQNLYGKGSKLLLPIGTQLSEAALQHLKELKAAGVLTSDVAVKFSTNK